MTERGIHWSASTNHAHAWAHYGYWRDELGAMGVKWVKLLDDGAGSSVALCRQLVIDGFEPIVRLYRPRPNPGRLQTLSSTVPLNPLSITSANITTTRLLVEVGVEYFESNNEPNLIVEWNYADWHFLGWKQKVAAVMDSWLVDAGRIIQAGGKPGFPALAQCAHTMSSDAIGSIPFTIEAVDWLAKNRADETKYAFTHGAWIAVHAAALNHPLNYPDDPRNQADHPNETVFQDDCCLRGWEVPHTLIKETFDVDLPVISTEGGVFVPKNGWQQWDDRYPALTYDSQAALTPQMFDWLSANAKPMIAMCPWLIANERMGHNDGAWTPDVWYTQEGERPVVQAMKNTVAAEPTPTGQQLREAAWNQVYVPYNPEAAFPVFARQHDLGFPVTGEFDVANVRLQGFAQGIVCCVVGDWGRPWIIKW